jgi:cytoskeleton protein RodZ
MSAQPAAGHEDNKVVELTETPGRRLRAARQSRGIEVERIAAELHLKPAAIAALEHDDYDTLPGPVFVAGYMRNYARLLNIDPEPVLAAYRAATQTPTTPAARAPAGPTREPHRAGGSAVRVASLFLSVALAGLAVVWWQTQQPITDHGAAAENTDSSTGQAVAEETPAPEMTAPVSGDQQNDGTDIADQAPPEPPPPTAATPPEASSTAQPVAASQASTPEDSAPPPAAEQLTEKPAAPASTQENGVVMEFSGPCWVDIRDSERSYKLLGEMHQGERRVLEGKPPYSVILGNVAAVKVTVDGIPFDLDHFAHGNVARFKLDPSKLP